MHFCTVPFTNTVPFLFLRGGIFGQIMPMNLTWGLNLSHRDNEPYCTSSALGPQNRSKENIYFSVCLGWFKIWHCSSGSAPQPRLYVHKATSWALSRKDGMGKKSYLWCRHKVMYTWRNFHWSQRGFSPGFLIQFRGGVANLGYVNVYCETPLEIYYSSITQHPYIP